jgi:hypothetical protein
MPVSSNPDQDHPGTGGNDNDEAIWQDLVARLQEPSDGFLDDDGPPSAAANTSTFRDFDPLGVWRAPSDTPSQPAPSGPRDYAAPDDEEGFVPADPPSLAGSDPAIVAAWVGAAGGPVFLFLAAIFWRDIPLVVIIAVISAFIACAGYLVYRLPNHRDDDDDGAVV